MKKRHTQEQIIRILQEADSGVGARDLCREHNICEQTFYRWRNKYGGMQVSDAKRPPDLEQENARLKRIVSDLTLDNTMLRDVNQKKW